MWQPEVGGHGWGNKELQYYTDSTENAALDGAVAAEQTKEPFQAVDLGVCVGLAGLEPATER